MFNAELFPLQLFETINKTMMWESDLRIPQPLRDGARTSDLTAACGDSLLFSERCYVDVWNSNFAPGPTRCAVVCSRPAISSPREMRRPYVFAWKRAANFVPAIILFRRGPLLFSTFFPLLFLTKKLACNGRSQQAYLNKTERKNNSALWDKKIIEWLAIISIFFATIDIKLLLLRGKNRYKMS